MECSWRLLRKPPQDRAVPNVFKACTRVSKSPAVPKAIRTANYPSKATCKDPDEENMRITVIREFEDSRTLDLQDATILGFQESRIPGFQDSIMLRVWDSRRQEFRIPGV